MIEVEDKCELCTDPTSGSVAEREVMGCSLLWMVMVRAHALAAPSHESSCKRECASATCPRKRGLAAYVSPHTCNALSNTWTEKKPKRRMWARGAYGERVFQGLPVSSMFVLWPVLASSYCASSSSS